jgi:hypothetical protein
MKNPSELPLKLPLYEQEVLRLLNANNALLKENNFGLRGNESLLIDIDEICGR